MSVTPFSRPAATQEKDLENLRSDFDRRRKSMRDYDDDVQYRGSGQIFNGSTKFVNAMLTLIVMLLAASIGGLVVLYGQVQGIASTVNLIVAGHIK